MTGPGVVRTVTAERFLSLWRDGAWSGSNYPERATGAPEAAQPARIGPAVAAIIEQVRRGGQRALLELTSRYDGVDLTCLEVGRDELIRAAGHVPAELSEALAFAAGRIREFAVRALERLNIDPPAAHGSVQGQGPDDGRAGSSVHDVWCPVERVGIYVPGGRAPYPSSVLMAAVPAQVAGVGEIVLCTPPAGPGGAVPPAVAAAALLSGVNRVFRLGGAQAVAAMAFGAGEVPRVDKLVGPGNAFVTEAKRQLYGLVGLDGLAGPSEVLGVAGHRGAARPLAWQLLAQAEHDPLALPLAVVLPPLSAGEVVGLIGDGLSLMPPARRDAAAAALASRGAVISADGLRQAAGVVDAVRPEHLWIDLGNRSASASFGRRVAAHAAAVCIGPGSPVAAGDYAAGPSHVLPTGGTARWASPLGVLDFMRRVSWVDLGPEDTPAVGRAAAVIARYEGFWAHERTLQQMTGTEVASGGKLDG
ncbi:MAG: histidinol dehydrogenase [Bacillota bacterium]|nr:histidinol dehydrogenase [Bacillota bacterium]